MEFPRVECPCKKDGIECEERFELCHSVCPKFLEYEAYRKMVRNARKFQLATDPNLSYGKRKKRSRR